MKRPATALLLAALSLSPLACRDRAPSRPAPAPAPAPHTAAAVADASTAPSRPAPEVDLATLDARLDAEERLAERRPNDWLQWEVVARGAMERARRSGDYNDYARAERALDRAFAAAPQGSGPLVTRVKLNYTLHRLSRVEPDLAAIERWAVITRDQRDLVASMRSDVAFHSGRYDDARRGYEARLAVARDVANLVAMAQLEWKTARFTQAEALLSEAARAATTEGSTLEAWVSMVRGMMALDRGRYDEAVGHYREGLRATPGSWVLEEHAAEALLLGGHVEEARLMYADLVARTHDPEFMDAMAEIAERQRHPDEAARWVREARAGHDARVRLFPEAAAGHALEHYLRRDPRVAVGLAERNRDARPGGEAQVRLARAYLRVGRLADARRVIEATLTTPWNTAEQHAVASVVFRLSGDAARADAERARAVAINPHAMDDASAYEPDPSVTDAGVSDGG